MYGVCAYMCVILLNGIYSQDSDVIPTSYDVIDIEDQTDVSINLAEEQNDTSPHFYLAYTSNPFGPSADLEELSQSQSRIKRSAIHLYNMVVCATGCNPLAYKGYGCFCGFLGSGYAVDPIDRCCKDHDWCYSTADCPMLLYYFVPYVWTCYKRRPLCALGASNCGQRLCECDRRLAECLSHYPCPGRKAICRSSKWRFFQNILML